MAKKIKSGHYYCSTFRQNFHFFIGSTYQQFVDFVEDNYGVDIAVESPPNGKCVTLYNESHGDIYLIWTEKKLDSPDGISDLTHECVHAAHFCLIARGIKHDQTDEPLAYLVGALVRSALEQFKGR